eukprot:m.72616 g.72616  ORF g.72616 m.72616 type:complete len:210 (+) comp16112_c0_seq2:258-887(+)
MQHLLRSFRAITFTVLVTVSQVAGYLECNPGGQLTASCTDLPTLQTFCSAPYLQCYGGLLTSLGNCEETAARLKSCIGVAVSGTHVDNDRINDVSLLCTGDNIFASVTTDCDVVLELNYFVLGVGRPNTTTTTTSSSTSTTSSSSSTTSSSTTETSTTTTETATTRTFTTNTFNNPALQSQNSGQYLASNVLLLASMSMLFTLLCCMLG